MLIDLSDEELAVFAREGKFNAFEELVRRYSSPLFRFVLGLVGDYEDAGDILQQSLIQIHASLPAWQDTGSFRNWIFTIARHKCLDHLRKKRIPTFSQLAGRRSDEPPSKFFEQLKDDAPLPETLLERQVTRQLLNEAIETLPERYKSVVLLRYTTDMSFQEIGQVLQIPENSAKTFYQRSKALLRAYLKDRL
jgi:RNA polymerase sigma-70 factor (ECF subfamily)